MTRSVTSDEEIHIDSYVVRRGRTLNGRNGGGVCIFVRTNSSFVESLSIELENRQDQSLSLSLHGIHQLVDRSTDYLRILKQLLSE